MADQDDQAQLRGTAAVNGRTAAAAARQSHAATPVQHSAAGNGKVAKRDSDQIVAEIERTRQNLARTIDSLADRVSPASNARRLREQAAEQLSRPEVRLALAAVALAGTGLVIYRIWGRRRG